MVIVMGCYTFGCCHHCDCTCSYALVVLITALTHLLMCVTPTTSRGLCVLTWLCWLSIALFLNFWGLCINKFVISGWTVDTSNKQQWQYSYCSHIHSTINSITNAAVVQVITISTAAASSSTVRQSSCAHSQWLYTVGARPFERNNEE